MDDDLSQIVKRVVGEALGAGPSTSPKAPPSAPLRVPAPTPADARPSTAPSVPTSITPAAGPIALGADHGGYALKEALKKHLETQGYSVIDCGTHSTDSVDYPDFARAVAVLVGQGKAWRGIVVDGAGIGSSMAANKVNGVRASLCYDHATARNAREHNDANVLTLGAGLIGESLALQIADLWLTTPFGGGRHTRRVQKIMQIEDR